MRTIISSQELYQYLIFLFEKLESRGANDLAKKVIFASKFASGSASELFGEAKIVLVDVIKHQSTVLTDQEVASTIKIIRRIDEEFSWVNQ